ncbi:MAG: T9SS type A sorting domain-containing protein [Bacteroidia bacterium]
MPESGIAVFRSGSDSTANYFALTGKHGSALLSSDAHNQADDGAFFMMVNGQNMALTPGYLAYDMRDSVDQAKNHSMLLVNGQGTLQGIPGMSNGANCYIEKYFQSPVQNYAELRTNYLNTDINRKVMHVRNRYFLLIDHLYGSVPQSYQWQLHGFGLAGGNATSGIYYDLTANNRSYWKKNNSVLFSHITSDVPIAFSKQTNYHEFTYRTFNTHTTLIAFTISTRNATFMSCLQGVKNISTDTLASNVLNIAGTTALKYSDNGYTDIAVSKSNNNLVTIPKATTGLQNDFVTDAQFFWTSEKGGSIVDLFMYKGTSLKQNTKTLLTTSAPMNIQYLQTGAKSYSGYCGDSGTVIFYTGEYTFNFFGDNVLSVVYDTVALASTVHFGGAGKFSFVLDNSRIGVETIFNDRNSFSIYPNPSSEKISIRFKNTAVQKLQFSLFDLDGKTLLEQTADYNGSPVSIDISGISSGIYFLRFSDASGNLSLPVKILISR